MNKWKKEKKIYEKMLTWEAIRAHLFPSLAWSSMMIFSSSGVKDPFFRFGRRWFAHRNRQLLPHRSKPEFFCTAFQLPSPCFLTYSVKIASSVVVHGPFFNPLPSIVVVAVVSPPPSILFNTATLRSRRGRKRFFSLLLDIYDVCICIYICIYEFFVCYEFRYIEKKKKRVNFFLEVFGVYLEEI